MDKSDGFMRYPRKDAPVLDVRDRVNSWAEFCSGHGEEAARAQAARCMECGTPYCHFKCPLNCLIPEWNDLACRGQWKEAYRRLMVKNDFPEFTGRVCPALCEGACTVGLNGDPVTIRNNEKSVIEHAFMMGWVVPCPPVFRTGKRVAVIGSGPAGLACANRLNRAGHAVTVYDKADAPGGLLMYGIPNMKLDKSGVLKRRMDILREEGIRFVLDTDVGRTVGLGDLTGEYDASVLCIGAAEPRDIRIPGREFSGIYFAVDYLKENTIRLLSGKDSAKGPAEYCKSVAVIGGGDTGTDCVATAIRNGCKKVTQLEIMPKPSPSRTPDNQWPEWPRVFRTDYGQEEAKELFGEDPRVYEATVTEIVGDGSGRTVSLKYAKSGKVTCLKAELVIIAAGFTGPEKYLLESSMIETDGKGNIKTAPGSFMTNIKGIFAAGDAKNGQSLVARAIRDGIGAASDVDRFLRMS